MGSAKTALQEAIALLKNFVSDRNAFGGGTIDDAIETVCEAAVASQSDLMDVEVPDNIMNEVCHSSSFHPSPFEAGLFLKALADKGYHLANRHLIGQGWLPIDTVPLDGTEVDLWVKHTGGHEYRLCSCSYDGKQWWDGIIGEQLRPYETPLYYFIVPEVKKDKN